MRDAGACVKDVSNPLADGIVAAADAVQVNVAQDACAVPGPGGDLGGGAGGVQQ